jgi:adenosine deaminase
LRRRSTASIRSRNAGAGIVGIDIAGPRPNADGPYPYRTLRPFVQQARDAGPRATIHVGEEGGAYGIAEIREVVSTLRPDRIGHGILAARDKS